MDDIDRSELLHLGGGMVVSFGPAGLDDLRCYYEAMELYLASSHADRTAQLRLRSDKVDPAVRNRLLPSTNALIWDDYFPSELRGSVLVSLMSFVERYLDGVCAETRVLLRKPVSHKQFNGSSIDRSQIFLTDLCLLSLPTKESWETMRRLQRLRNIIVHNGGIPETPQREVEARRLAEYFPGCTASEVGIDLEPDFVRYALKATFDFMAEMSEAVSLVCRQISAFER